MSTSLKYLFFSLLLAIPLAGMAESSPDQDADEVEQEPALPSAGSEAFYKGKAEGWFWYKQPPEPVKPKKKKQTPPPPPPPPPAPTPEEKKPEPVKGPDLFSVAWIKKNLPVYRDIAIDNPTVENIQRYYYLQRLMMDKANKFAEMSSTVIMKDPFLDEDSRRPVATYAAHAMNREVGIRADAALKSLSKKVGLFYFFKSDCMICAEQAGVLQALTFKTGIQIIPVSLDGNPLDNGLYPDYRVDDGQAKKMNIFNAPALALAIPPDKTEIVGYGAITLEVLQNRIFMAARDSKVMTQEEFAQTQPYVDTGLLSLDDGEGLVEEDLKDPAKFVEHMRNQLARKNSEGSK